MDRQKHLVHQRKSFSQVALTTSVLAGLLVPFNSVATALNLSQSPLFLGSTAIPNVMLMMDDSGSMDWEILTRKHWDRCAYSASSSCSVEGTLVTTGEILDTTSAGGYDEFLYLYDNPTNLYDDWLFFTFNSYEEDGSHGYYRSVALASEGPANISTALESISNAQSWEATTGDWRVFSSELNTVYYNPDITYSSWLGSTYPDASFTAANESPDGSGTTRNLTNAIYIVADDDKGFSGTSGPMSGATYSTTSNGLIDLWDSHTIYNIGSSSVRRYRVTATEASDGSLTGLSYTDLGAITDTTQVNAIKQNFSNWYQYHRRRYFNLKGSLASLISASPNYRYMLGAINSSSVLVDAPSDNDNLAAHNDNLISSMLGYNLAQQGTPLRQGLNLAGSYFMSTDSGAPIENACQLNFTVLMTDGFWNGSFSNSSIGDQDGDTYSQTLADVADYYYDTDLRSDLADTVPTSSSDSNTQQHMNTLTLSFGLKGSLSDSNGDGWPDVNGVNLTSNSTIWGDPTLGSAFEDKVNDLWHAAFNSKGAYVDVTASSTLLDSLNSVLSTVDERTGSAASVTLSTGSVSGSDKIFQGRFNSSDWSGDVLAYAIDSSTGNVSTSSSWRASTQLNAKDSNERNIIFSYLGDSADSYTGRAFTSSNLPSDWDAALLTSKLSVIDGDDAYVDGIVDYLRGDSTHENGDGFRVRSGKLGDIVSSSPMYVGAPSETSKPYSSDAGYTTFKTTYSARAPMIYVGANDGMLHVFNAADGEEELAYIASGVKDNLYKLANPGYSHQFYFNATPVIKDVYGSFTDGNEWKSVLVTGFGAGAKGLAALDVTDPESFDASNADILPLWEFKEENITGSEDVHSTTHPYMGHIYGQPSIAKMNNGQWAVITGNGYNSIDNGGSNGKSVLFILDVTSGIPIKIIETSAGNETTPGGLSETALVDTDNDGVVDFIYAGDFLGNLWKFDVSSNNADSWGVSYTNASTNIPLFAAGSTQPVTGGITVGRHEEGRGRMVYFGTGRYLTSSDHSATGQSDQAFYGIWDADTSNSDFNASLTSTSLLAQDITLQTTFTVAVQGSDGNDTSSSISVTARETSRNVIDWTLHKGWYLPLVDPDDDDNGERMITKAQLRNGRIIFTTLQPTSSVCQVGGESWLMELDANSGARLTTVSLDLNQDGQFDQRDYSYINASASLQCSTGSCVPPSGILFNEIVAPPAILNAVGKETKYLSGSSGSITKVNENPGTDRLGRQGWRQIYLFLQ